MNRSSGEPGAAPHADRHRAREAALRMLYQWEVGGGDLGGVLRSYWTIDLEEDTPPGPAVEPFARTLVEGTAQAIVEIDPLIAAAARHWRIDRMAIIDRLVLRLAVYELRHGDSPAAVVIDEAIELARTFSGEEAVGFVNGVLDAVRKRLEEEASGLGGGDGGKG